VQSLRAPPADDVVEQLWLARTISELGRLLLETGSPESLELFLRAETMAALAAERGADASMARRFMIEAIRNKYDALAAAGRYPEALAASQHCSRVCREHLNIEQNNAAVQQMLFESLRKESEAHLHLGEFAVAIQVAKLALDEAMALRQHEPAAVHLRGLEWIARTWLLEALISSAERAAVDNELRDTFIEEARTILIAIETLEREASDGGTSRITVADSPDYRRRQILVARQRLEALTQ
jgi:hypothetical protein